MKNLISRLLRDEEGQDVIEYVLIAAAISVIAIPIVPQIGTRLTQVWNAVQGQVDAIPTPGGGS